MKYRVLVGLLVLAGVGVWVSCGGYSSNPQTNPGVTGTGLVFVATQGDNTISPFTLDQAAGRVTSNGKGVATGTLPIAAIMTPAQDAIFVVNKTSNDVSRYTIKPDGTLTAVTPNISVGGANSNPIAVAMDAAGKFLFVLNEGPFGVENGGAVAVFSIGQNAGLTAVTTTATALDNASAIAVTPDGEYLYETESLASTIVGYSVDANGGMTVLSSFAAPVPPTPPSTTGGTPGGNPIHNTTTPMGLLTTPDDVKNPSANPIFLYVTNANAGAGNISVYEICDKPSLNCSNTGAEPGELIEVTGSPFAAGGEPGPMVIVSPAVVTPPAGTFLYASDHKLNRVLQYSVSVVTGTLTPLSPASVSTGTSPVWVGARHDGQYLFAANNGSTSLSAYTITDPKTGNLTNAATAIVPTVNNPTVVLVK